MENENYGALKFLGVVTILYGLAYAVLGTLSLAGTIIGVLPGHEKQEIVIVVLSYTITLVSLIGGIASIKGNYKRAKTIGFVFTILGLTSLISNQLTQDMFNSFDCIAMVLGVGIIALATLAETRQKELEKALKQKKQKEDKEKERKNQEKNLPKTKEKKKKTTQKTTKSTKTKQSKKEEN